MPFKELFIEDGEYNEAAILLACACTAALSILLAMDLLSPREPFLKQSPMIEHNLFMQGGLTHDNNIDNGNPTGFEALPGQEILPSLPEQGQAQDPDELDDLAFIEKEKKEPFLAVQYKWQMIEMQEI